MRIRIEITAKLSSTGYLLEMEGSKREAEVHVGKLKLYLPLRRAVNGFEKYASKKGVDWKHAGHRSGAVRAKEREKQRNTLGSVYIARPPCAIRRERQTARCIYAVYVKERERESKTDRAATCELHHRPYVCARE